LGQSQTELLNRKRWKTRIELANAIFDYLEIFHNRQRRLPHGRDPIEPNPNYLRDTHH